MSVARIAWAVGALVVGLGVVAFNDDTHPSVVAPPAIQVDTGAITPAMIAEGRRIFHGKGTCFACHGSALEGGPVAPTLKPHAWKDARGGELASIYYVDTHGVAGTVMVSHPGGISDAEAQSVAAYIWSVDQGRAKP